MFLRFLLQVTPEKFHTIMYLIQEGWQKNSKHEIAADPPKVF